MLFIRSTYFRSSLKYNRYINNLSVLLINNKRSMSSFLHFVGHSSSEGPPTIIFQHEKARYMFNCREGTQRQCVEDKVKLAKLKSIFLTRTHWDCSGGLPGKKKKKSLAYIYVFVNNLFFFFTYSILTFFFFFSFPFLFF